MSYLEWQGAERICKLHVQAIFMLLTSQKSLCGMVGKPMGSKLKKVNTVLEGCESFTEVAG
jgi:hypothetical protein